MASPEEVPRAATILVVDDEPLIRWALSQQLRAEGHTVLEAATGRQALELGDETVDLALLDYRLPDVDGMTLLRQLKQRNPCLAVLMLTAHASTQIKTEALEAGAFHLLDKPFDLEQVSLLVRACLAPEHRHTP